MAKNQETLFARLSRIVRSGPVVRRKIQTVDTQTTGFNTQSSGQGMFLRNGTNTYQTIIQDSHNTSDRFMRYQDFNQMETMAEIVTALNIFADETVAQDEKGRCFHIYSNNTKIKSILEDLFYNIINVEFNLRPWTRSLVKYGDLFLYNDVSEKYGVQNVVPIQISQIERMEGFDKEEPFAVKFKLLQQSGELNNWEVTHVRLLGNDMFIPYGTSVLDGARKIWRQLTLAEDAMLTYRMTRATDRRVFYIDVGNTPANDVPNLMEQSRAQLRTSPVVDRATGRVDLRFASMDIQEDYFIATRGDRPTAKVENITGGQNTAAVEDIAYLQKKLISALQVPAPYLGFAEMLGGKGSLAQEDIRFSRTITAIQRTLISELNKLAIIHLVAHGYDGEDLLDFNLRLSNPSTVAQMQKLELFKQRFDIAANAPEKLLSRNYLLKTVVGLTDEEVRQVDQEIVEDRIRELQLENMTVDGEEGDASGDTGDTGGGEEPDATADETPDATGGDAGEEAPINANDDPEEDAYGVDLLTSSDDFESHMSIDADLSKMPLVARSQVRSQHEAVKKSKKKQKWNPKYNYRRRRTAGNGGKEALGFAVPKPLTKRFKDPNDTELMNQIAKNPISMTEQIALGKLERLLEEQQAMPSPSIHNDVSAMLTKMTSQWKQNTREEKKLIFEELDGEILNINITEKDE